MLKQTPTREMSVRERNKYLDTEEDSQDEESGYDSEAAEQGRGMRSFKRRKTSHTPSLDEESLHEVDSVASGDHNEGEEDQDESDEERDTDGQAIDTHSVAENGVAQDPNIQEPHDDGVPTEDESEPASETNSPYRIPQSPPAEKPRTEPKGRKTTDKANGKGQPKSGVVYLSRVPPFMKPSTVKHYLERYGAINRVFLTPEDPTSHTARVRRGGNKKRSFVDGWVEFVHKRDAKLVAETLNANIIGGKKGSYYHDDVWNIRYLRGFKWKDLTEQIKNENAERASRLRMEISQTTRENKRFVQNVEKAKMLERMEGKRKRKAGVGTEGGLTPAASTVGGKRDIASAPRSQSAVMKSETNGNNKKKWQGTDTKQILDMVL